MMDSDEGDSARDYCHRQASMTIEWNAAIQQDTVDELQRLRDEGADVDARDEHGQTALMIAAVAGHGAVVEWLIRQGADLNHTAKYGLSALILGVINGHMEVVRML